MFKPFSLVRNLGQDFLEVPSSRLDRTHLKHNKFKITLNTSHKLINILASKFPLVNHYCCLRSSSYAVTNEAPASKVWKGKRWLQQVENKMRRSDQEASWIQYAINVLHKGDLFGPKTKRNLSQLHNLHRTQYPL